jgi:hypothetical protein
MAGQDVACVRRSSVELSGFSNQSTEGTRMTGIHKRLLTVSALALAAGFMAHPVMAAPAQAGDIILAQARTSDPGSRPGDVPGTQQPVPAPGTDTRGLNSPTQQTTPSGAQPGDIPGTQTPVPAPAPRASGSSNPGGASGAQLGDVPGTQQPTPLPGAREAPGSSTNQRSVAVPTKCAGEPTEQARLACMQRSSTEQGKPGGQ